MTILKVFLVAIFVILSNEVVPLRIEDMWTKNNYTSLFIYLFVWIVCLIGLWSLSFLASKRYRFLGSLCLFVSTVGGMTFFNISEHYLSYDDMELLWISRSESLNALKFYGPEMIQPAFISLLGIIGVLLPGRNQFNFLGKFNYIKSILKGMILIPYFILAMIVYLKFGHGTYGMPQQFSSMATMAVFLGHNLVGPSMVEERQAPLLSLNKNNSHHDLRYIIYIVDESVRADYLDLNQERGTTPFLKELAPRIANFGTISAGNNCSAYSNAILRMGAQHKTMAEIGQRPLIWQYAKMAGYRTVYLDGQMKKGQLQNFMGPYEQSLIDQFVQFNNAKEYEVDHLIAHRIKQVIASDEKVFIYVNKRGSHFPYNASFKRDQQVFVPSMEDQEVLGTADKNHLINSYKNSIHWNVNEFFKILTADQSFGEGIILYTADHGQNLMDHETIMTHCNTVNPHPVEGNVPLFLMTDKSDLLAEVQEYALRNKDKATHFNLFATILEWMNFNHTELSLYYEKSLRQDLNEKRKFSAGPIIPRFGRPVNWFDIELKK